MDACLCVFDETSGEVNFAGAKRPIYLVRAQDGSESELIEIKGDRSSIGGRQREAHRVYTARPLDVVPGDMLYLTTDGFGDQSNPSGKKFGSERLKGLLRTIASKEPSAQQLELESELDKHQGEEKQRDDITIVGVRILPPGRTV
jgi:serine phosphatase RsbU (regulator of sigma subunit)